MIWRLLQVSIVALILWTEYFYQWSSDFEWSTKPGDGNPLLVLAIALFCAFAVTVFLGDGLRLLQKGWQLLASRWRHKQLDDRRAPRV